MKIILTLVLVSITIFGFSQGDLKLIRGSVPVESDDNEINEGNTCAIIVGVSNYKYLPKLNYAHRDALAFREYLMSENGGFVKETNIKTFTNVEVTKSNFWINGWTWLKNKDLKEGDKLFLYFAGHGDASSSDEYYILGHDCSNTDAANYNMSSAIEMYLVKSRIKEFLQKKVKVFLIIDACRSNELPGGTTGNNNFIKSILEDHNGEVKMFATSPNKPAYETQNELGGNGLFTYYLLKGLNGEAKRDHSYEITLADIQEYVKPNVRKASNNQQIPSFCCDENNYLVINKVVGNTVPTLTSLNFSEKESTKRSLSLSNSFVGAKDVQLNNTKIQTDSVYEDLMKQVNQTNKESLFKTEALLLRLKFDSTSSQAIIQDAQDILSSKKLQVLQSLINDYHNSFVLSSVDCISSFENRDFLILNLDTFSLHELRNYIMDVEKNILPDFDNFRNNVEFVKLFLDYFSFDSYTLYEKLKVRNECEAMFAETKSPIFSNLLGQIYYDLTLYTEVKFYLKNTRKLARSWKLIDHDLSKVNIPNFTRNRLSGNIIGQDNLPLVDAKIKLFDQFNQDLPYNITSTDEKGRFIIPKTPTGLCQLRVSHEDYEERVIFLGLYFGENYIFEQKLQKKEPKILANYKSVDTSILNKRKGHLEVDGDTTFFDNKNQYFYDTTFVNQITKNVLIRKTALEIELITDNFNNPIKNGVYLILEKKKEKNIVGEVIVYDQQKEKESKKSFAIVINGGEIIKEKFDKGIKLIAVLRK